MAVSKLRNRVVLFRLTQDEYNSVQKACAEGSARSISDFARMRILGSGSDISSLTQIESTLAELSQSVENLTRLLTADKNQDKTSDQSSVQPRASAATAGHNGTGLSTPGGD